ncbi:MAG TPA: FKBP-type peptidyl-prolyl cis-trans isomerase [Mycobacteriales bacterium]|nr:FKBP-type peptidyl-prolyl cis-trans isomerase [Mycobacteriales bacterium]
MATSRRRERELARRRFERRRQAELERRARMKRRNTVIGASVGTVAVIVVLVIVGIVLFGGSNKNNKVKAGATPSVTPTPSTSASIPPAPTKCAKITPNPPAKGEPKIPDVKGKAPTKLVVKNIKAGKGKAAKKGDTITVKYVGISCSDGKPFDASYTDGAKNQEFSFQLGAGKVIPGWDQGLLGMKAGGVRELVIPAALGYGTSGSGQIKPNETLIFVVTMVKV